MRVAKLAQKCGAEYALGNYDDASKSAERHIFTKAQLKAFAKECIEEYKRSEQRENSEKTLAIDI